MATSPVEGARRNWMAIAGMVFGIAGFLACWIPIVGNVLQGLGVVFGTIGLLRFARLGYRDAAITGIIAGFVGYHLLPFIESNAVPAVREVADDEPEEARGARKLTRISTMAWSYGADHDELPPSTGTVMPGPPGAACGAPGDRLPVRPGTDWDADPGWRALRFQVEWPSRYSYAWTRDSPHAGHAEMFADLDCDGQISVTRIEFELVDGEPHERRLAPTPD